MIVWWFFAGVAIKLGKVGLTCQRISKYSMITECQNIIVGQLVNWSSSSCDVIVYVLTVELLAWKFLSSVLYSLSEVEWLQNVHYVSPCTCICDEKKVEAAVWRSLYFWHVMYMILSISIALKCYVHNPFAFNCIGNYYDKSWICKVMTSYRGTV